MKNRLGKVIIRAFVSSPFVLSFSFYKVINITYLANNIASVNMYLFRICLCIFYYTLTNAKLYNTTHKKFTVRVSRPRDWIEFWSTDKNTNTCSGSVCFIIFWCTHLEQGFETATPAYICIYCVQFCSFHNNVKVYFYVISNKQLNNTWGLPECNCRNNLWWNWINVFTFHLNKRHETEHRLSEVSWGQIKVMNTIAVEAGESHLFIHREGDKFSSLMTDMMRLQCFTGTQNNTLSIFRANW